MQPTIKPLSYRHRNFVFITFTIIFLISLPAFIFYSAGYRYDFFADEPTVTATGGLYVASEALNSQIYIDEVEVDNTRIFRKASYIQGIEPGLHRVHVQAPNLHTWVKNIEVKPQIVTEVEAFNLPVVSQVRPITKYVDSANNLVYLPGVPVKELFSQASSAVEFIEATSTATSTYQLNSEFVLIQEIFTEKASTTAFRLALEEEQNKDRFGFATTTPRTTIQEIATTTTEQDYLRLFQRDEDVFVEAFGVGKQVPFYFCVDYTATSSTAFNRDPLNDKVGVLNRVEQIFEACRPDIKIDRKNKKVYDFNFFPDNSDLVLMLLDDGLYVTEVDDRSWQNSQLLYPGENLEMVVYSGSIFVKKGDYIFEALTTIDRI